MSNILEKEKRNLIERIIKLSNSQELWSLFKVRLEIDTNLISTNTAPAEQVQQVIGWLNANDCWGKVKTFLHDQDLPQSVNLKGKKFGNFPGCGAYFTDRTTILNTIFSELSSKCIALSGMSGVGKTQIALKYCTEYKKDYQYVFWVNAKIEYIVEDFCRLSKQCPELKLDENQKSNDQIKEALAVKDKLQSLTDIKWLLVLDNADFSDISPYSDGNRQIQNSKDFWQDLVHKLPKPSENNHILLTTLPDEVGSYVQAIPVDVWSKENRSEEDGIDFFLCRIDIETYLNRFPAENRPEARKKAGEIVREVGGLPLALNQAGAYIKDKGTPLERYLKLYRSRKRKVEFLKMADKLDSHTSVWVTFELALEELKKKNEFAVELIYVCAFLASDDIPDILFTKFGAVWDAALNDENQLDENQLDDNEFRFEETVGILRSFALIDRNGYLLSIHRIVQDVIREMLPKGERQTMQKTIINTLNKAFPVQVEDQDQWSQCDKLLPHVFEAQQWIDELNISEEESSSEIAEQAAELLFKAGYYLYVRSKYQRAEELLQESRKIIDNLMKIEEGQGQRDLQVKLSDIKHQLAKTYKKFSKNQDAEKYFQECLELRKSILGEEDAKVANVLYNMAEFYRLQGKNKKAFQKYRSALTIRQNLLEQAEDEKSDSSQEEIIEKKLHLASTYNGIGSFCIGRNDFKKAEKFVKRSLEIRQSLMDSAEEEQEGKYARYVYRCLNNLGIILGEQEKYPEAEKYLKKAIYYLEEKVFKGKKHSHIGTSSSNLGTVYKLQGEIALQQKKQEEAEKLFNKAYESYDKALDQRISTLGPDNPITGRAYMLLAYVCKLLNTEEKAKKAKIYENEVNRIKQKNSDKEGIDKYFKDKFDTY